MAEPKRVRKHRTVNEDDRSVQMFVLLLQSIEANYEDKCVRIDGLDISGLLGRAADNIERLTKELADEKKKLERAEQVIAGGRFNLAVAPTSEEDVAKVRQDIEDYCAEKQREAALKAGPCQYCHIRERCIFKCSALETYAKQHGG